MEGMGMIIYFAAIIAIFYFLLVRPQKKKDKAHREMVASLKKDDEILTTSGFVCKIVSVDKNGVYTVKLGDAKVKMYDWAINSVLKTNDKLEVPQEETEDTIFDEE